MKNPIKIMTTALLVAVLPSSSQCMMNNNPNFIRNNISNNVSNNIQQYINNINNYLKHINDHCRVVNARCMNQNLGNDIDSINDIDHRIGRIEYYMSQIQNGINNLRQDVNSMRQHHNFQNNMMQNMNNNLINNNINNNINNFNRIMQNMNNNLINNNINNNINNFNRIMQNMNLNNNGNNIFNNNMNFNNNQNNMIQNNINDNRSLKDLLNMDITFSYILYAIRNNENIDANINKFYDYILENKLYNLERIISSNDIANADELNAINKILDMEIVRNKFNDYITGGEQQSIKEEFNQNRFGTVIISKKNEFLNDYKSSMNALVKKKLKIYQQEGAQDFNILKYLYELLNKQQENTVKYNIVVQILDLFTTLFHDHDETFKEIAKYHNIRNIINDKDGNNKMENTFSQIEKDIDNDIRNGRDMNTASSSKEFYNSLFGNDFDNFKTVLQAGTNEEYEIILNILKKKQIQKYISGEGIKNKLNAKNEWKEEYEKCNRIIKHIDDSKNMVNENNQEIFQIVIKCFNIRMENVFSQMKKDIENDIKDKKDMNTVSSSKEFYNLLFGNNFENFKIVLQSGTKEEYEIILDILQKLQIQAYISGEGIRNKLNTEDKWKEEHDKCDKIIKQIKDIGNSKKDIKNEYIVNVNNKEIFQIVKDCFNRRMEIIREQNNFNMINEE